ncbi:MAG TPA: hypothetical protein VGP48_02780 [Stellaceae bacterium]|jgi:hypothetical protein|nr:hypothetical protein [Stellaceae bacterium]
MIGLNRYGLRLPRLLLIGCAFMLAIIVGELVFRVGVRKPPAAPAPIAGPTAALPAAPSPPGIDAYAEIAARPLFEPSRRPAPPDQAPSGPPPARPSVVVLGIALTGGTRYALVRHGNPPKVEQFTEGQNIDGWQIQAITGDHVTLHSGADTADFALGGRGGGPAPAAPNAVPAAPLSRSFGGGPDL